MRDDLPDSPCLGNNLHPDQTLYLIILFIDRLVPSGASAHVSPLGLCVLSLLQTFPLAAETGLDTMGQG